MALLPIPKRLELGDNPRDPLMWAMSRLMDRALAKIGNSGEDKPFPSFQDGLAVARTIEAIRKASRERCWVSLDGG